MNQIAAFKTFACAKALCLAVVFSCVTLTGAHAQQAAGAEIALVRPVFLQLEITASCTERGAVFKIINHGPKWPQKSVFRLYRATGKLLVTERSLRLAEGQKVSFVVKHKVMQGNRFAVWVDPSWYKREMKFDASIRCS